MFAKMSQEKLCANNVIMNYILRASYSPEEHMSDQKVSLSAPPVTPQELAVPSEIVPLPSRGFAYPPGHPLHKRDGIQIKAMTAHDEDILTSRALIRSGRVISALLRS